MPQDFDPDKNNRDPWGRPRKNTPPDLEQLIKKFFKKLFGGSSSGGFNGKFAFFQRFSWAWIIAAFVLIWLLFGIYVVSPQQEAVVMRFGRYVSSSDPGLHWLLPGVMSKKILNVQVVNSFSYNAEMLTKDENIVQVAVAVQYQILNPRDYLFNVADPITTLHQATASALRQVVGHTNLDGVITVDRQAVIIQMEKTLNAILANYNTGLLIRDVKMQQSVPPSAVTDAFDDATKAREDKQRYINKAQAYANRVESAANGQIARLQQSAKAYQAQVVLQAKAHIARYLAILNPYLAAPRITKERLYLQTMSQVLSGTTNVILDPSSHQIVYLPLDQLHRVTAGDDKSKPMPGVLGSAWQTNNTDTSVTGGVQ